MRDERTMRELEFAGISLGEKSLKFFEVRIARTQSRGSSVRPGALAMRWVYGLPVEVGRRTDPCLLQT
jgi:hypothetical protein